MKILIVEDDENIANAVKEILYLSNYSVEICDSGISAVQLIQKKYYDLVLLDIMLPGLSGFQVMERISYREFPVIFITAKQSINDKLCGFGLGAEDYIVKPFDIMELLARVEVVLRRNKVKIEYKYGDVFLNSETHIIRRNGVKVEMTPKEFELAEYFVKHQDLILSRELLFRFVWGKKLTDETRTIDNHIRQIRKKLDWYDYLIAIPKIGYKLIQRD